MKDPTKPLSDQQRRHLGELWVRNEDVLRGKRFVEELKGDGEAAEVEP